MRNAIAWAVLAVVLILSNLMIVGKERILTEGEPMLLQLAPRDPRSLMQGDYMALRYSVARQVADKLSDIGSSDGQIVVTLDEHQVARFARLRDDNTPLADSERLLAYRLRGDNVRLASDAYFFQEGHEPRYRSARYGELRVDTDGDAVLVALRDGDYRLLGGDAPQKRP